MRHSRWDHPRGRGEWADSLAFSLDLDGITPAGAGSGSPSIAASSLVRDHPRGRGEWIVSSPRLYGRLGSPPRARGVVTYEQNFYHRERITPAGAGSGKACLRSSREAPDHPRGRGEWTLGKSSAYLASGSPPRARGVVHQRHREPPFLGITPAGAGSGRVPCAHTQYAWDHPRGRGEWPYVVSRPMASPGSPPRARGVAPRSRRIRCRGGITPAGAGSGL